jgi:hypothetical protein
MIWRFDDLLTLGRGLKIKLFYFIYLLRVEFNFRFTH